LVSLFALNRAIPPLARLTGTGVSVKNAPIHAFSAIDEATKPLTRAAPPSHGIKDRVLIRIQPSPRLTDLIGLGGASNRDRA
jgi:hypothetical protein